MSNTRINSVMKLMISKTHPEYTDDEIWQEIWEYCQKNEQKITLFLKQYQFRPHTEVFAEKREQMMALLRNASDRELQRMLRMITNFDLAILFLLADKEVEERLRNNLSRRLEILIGGEAYTIAKQVVPNEEQFNDILDKVLNILLSEEMLR